MIRVPKPNERPLVRNVTQAQVSFAPGNLLVLKRGGAAFVDEHWTSFDSFRHDATVMALWRNHRIMIHYNAQGGTNDEGKPVP